MPKRPVQHQLEDLSRNKFALSLPEHWVFRDKDKDYGIDGEVELFDSSGKTTGLVFWVQLKATSSDDKSIIKSLDFDLDRLRYYKQLELPVLIARYTKNEDIFYVKWSDEVDPYYAKPEAKRIRVNFSEQDELNDEKLTQIHKYLINLRILKSRSIHLPISIRLSFSNDQIQGVSPSLLLTRIRSKLPTYNGVIKLEEDPECLAADVQIGDNELQVGFLHIVGATIHRNAMIEESTIAEDLLQDILLAISLSLSQLGNNELAARLIFTYNLQERLKRIPQILEHLLDSLLKTSYLEETLDLIQYILDTGNNHFLEAITNISMVFLSDNASSEKLNLIESFFKKNAERHKKSSPESFGISHYNLGSFFSSLNRHRDAVKSFLIAAKYEPVYCDDAVYYQRLGGALFEIGKFSFSALFYKKSLAIKHDDNVLPRYADALMFSGEYQKSLKIFDKYMEAEDKPKSTWVLKTVCLLSLVEHFQVESQKRNPKTAINLADVFSLPKEKAQEQLNKALQEDFLCGLAWFNLGQNRVDKQEPAEAAFCYTMCGLVQPWDYEAWVNAAICSFNDFSNTQFFILIIQTAYFFNDEQFLEKLYETFEANVKNNKQNQLAKFSEMVEQIISHEKKIKNMPEIRIKTEDEAFQDLESFLEDNNFN